MRITATEDGSGGILFKADVEEGESTADLRALFFDIDEGKLDGLMVSGGGPLLTEYRVSANNVLDLDDGANLAGKVKDKFDVGIEWGTPGGKKDNIDFEVSFTLTHTAGNLTLDDLAGLRFGAKLDSIGGQFVVLKNFELGPIVNEPFTIGDTSIDVFSDTFALTGVGSQSFSFFA